MSADEIPYNNSAISRDANGKILLDARPKHNKPGDFERFQMDEAPLSSAKIRAKLLVIGFVAALSQQVTTLSQTCPDFREMRRESVYAFSLALIDSFSHAKSALGRTEASSCGNSLDADFEMISAFKFAQRDYECTAKSVEPYKAAKNEKIRKAAELAHVVYLTLTLLSFDRTSIPV